MASGSSEVSVAKSIDHRGHRLDAEGKHTEQQVGSCSEGSHTKECCKTEIICLGIPELLQEVSSQLSYHLAASSQTFIASTYVQVFK